MILIYYYFNILLVIKIGDVRITFWGSDVSHISAMGKQASNVLKEFTLEPIDFMVSR